MYEDNGSALRPRECEFWSSDSLHDDMRDDMRDMSFNKGYKVYFIPLVVHRVIATLQHVAEQTLDTCIMLCNLPQEQVCKYAVYNRRHDWASMILRARPRCD